MLLHMVFSTRCCGCGPKDTNLHTVHKTTHQLLSIFLLFLYPMVTLTKFLVPWNVKCMYVYFAYNL